MSHRLDLKESYLVGVREIVSESDQCDRSTNTRPLGHAGNSLPWFNKAQEALSPSISLKLHLDLKHQWA